MAYPDRTLMDGDPAFAGLGIDRMRALLDYSWDILSLLDRDGHLIYNSPAAQRLHGFSPAEMDGRNTFDFFHPEDATGVAGVFQDCLNQPGLPFRVEYRYARKGGSWIWMEAVAVNLLDTPSIQAIVVNSRDITERVEGQQALRDSEQFSDLILNSLAANLVVLDERGCILKVNHAWRCFAEANHIPEGFVWEGLSYLEVCGKATGLGSGKARAMGEGLRAMLQGDRTEFTLEYPCDSPEEARWFQARVTRFQGSGPVRLVVSHLDITKLRQAEEQRLELERLLHRSQKMESLGSLAGGIAHDMNNVLGSILGIASMQEELQAAGSSTHQAFSIIVNACRRGGGLLRRLLDFSRRDLSEIRPVNLNALLQEEVLLLERTTLGQIQLVTEFTPNLQAIQGDSAALVHALMNLCLNAVDAMPGGGSLTLRTRNNPAGFVEVEVEDTGQGMSKEVMEKALDPFFTTKPLGKGTGLGLSIVYSTVNAHHGTMELRSEPGRGTTINLRFPALDETDLGQGDGEVSEEARPAPSLDILLVDDDDLIRGTLEQVILCLGHRVTTANSGEAALAQLATGTPPQVVILDVNMPGLGGQGTLPRLRELQPALPVLLATGRVDQDAAEMAEAFPKVSLLPKPFSMAELKARLERLMADS